MITVIKKPKYLALDIKLLKAHLRIEHDYEDEYLNMLVESATEILEKKIGMSILKKKYKCVDENIDSIPIYPICEILEKKGEIQVVAGIAETPSEVPSDLTYAILQLSKNMYECNKDENILEPPYIKHIVNNYKQVSIN